MRQKLHRLPWKGFILLAAFIALDLCGMTVHAQKGVYDWAFIRLDYVRDEKIQQLRHFSERIHALALQAAGDKRVLSFFDVNLQYSEALKKGPIPKALTQTVMEFRENFHRYYLEQYLSFYDFLFVDLQGEVFYTIRKESDMNFNLMQDDPKRNPLTRCLRKNPQSEVMIDFHDYGPTSKPAAFFIEPVRKNGVHMGWVILQCGIHKVNTIFAWNEDLGQTGETFLVNREGFMLTESNFVGDSTILKKRLDDRNIQAKFTERHGHRTVNDYRGFVALTSFEVFHFLGTNWLVVAKMDKDEIITRHYMEHQRYYADKLLTHLREVPASPLRVQRKPLKKEGLRVDMDEFLKASRGEQLQTFGISTCTGVVVSYPEKFAYMAHISPRDKLYGSDQTNLLGQMVKQVKSFDIRPCEKHRILFLVVAPHLDTLLPTVDKLIDEGILLRQIQVVSHPEAVSASMYYDYLHNDFSVAWRLQNPSGGKNSYIMKDAVNVGEVIGQMIQAEETKP